VPRRRAHDLSIATRTAAENNMTALTYVIPCSAAKLSHAAPARDLYVGQTFKHTLERALNAEVPGRVMILSAKHGLLDLDTIVEPYEVRITDADAIDADTLAAQAQAIGIDDTDVWALLPRAYFDRLDAALRQTYCFPNDCYGEVARGVGDHRMINNHL
jgi:hypothetical protein